MRRTDPTSVRAAGLLPAIALLLLPIAAPAQETSSGESGAAPEQGQTPPGVTQIIPRGTLASIDDPVFVTASEADMPDEQWVLGVEIDGVAHAYDLNLLNHHEVVNDVIGDKPVAAVW